MGSVNCPACGAWENVGECCNVIPRAEMTELEKRYQKTITFLQRIDKAEEKLHWEEGETVNEVLSEIRSFLSDLRLEGELMRIGHKPMDIGSAGNESDA